jgi:phasin family protein
MAKTGESTNGIFDMTKTLSDFRLPGLDVEAIVAIQRKNVEALARAGQLVVESLRAVAQRQAEIAQEGIAETSALLREWAKPGAPEDRLEKNVDIAKHAFEKGLSNARELSELAAKAGTDVFSVITRRVSEGFNEVGLYAKKHGSAE